jgi:hypothetical protein
VDDERGVSTRSLQGTLTPRICMLEELIERKNRGSLELIAMISKQNGERITHSEAAAAEIEAGLHELRQQVAGMLTAHDGEQTRTHIQAQLCDMRCEAAHVSGQQQLQAAQLQELGAQVAKRLQALMEPQRYVALLSRRDLETTSTDGNHGNRAEDLTELHRKHDDFSRTIEAALHAMPSERQGDEAVDRQLSEPVAFGELAGPEDGSFDLRALLGSLDDAGFGPGAPNAVVGDDDVVHFEGSEDSRIADHRFNAFFG